MAASDRLEALFHELQGQTGWPWPLFVLNTPWRRRGAHPDTTPISPSPRDAGARCRSGRAGVKGESSTQRPSSPRPSPPSEGGENSPNKCAPGAPEPRCGQYGVRRQSAATTALWLPCSRGTAKPKRSRAALASALHSRRLAVVHGQGARRPRVGQCQDASGAA